MTLAENEPLAPRTTLGVGGAARWLASITNETQIPEAVAWARSRELPWIVLGSGSNLLIADRGFPGLVLAMELRGIHEMATAGAVEVEAAAGEDWDSFVSLCIANQWSGVECLSGIPGTVGATPVQNVGAYGQEVAESIAAVRAWDAQQEAWVELKGGACGFGYRSSRFNGADAGRFVITAVRFRLVPGGAPAIRYPELQRRLAQDPTPRLADVREAVRALRHGKGMLLNPMDPEGRTAGSFFKNPVLPLAALPELARRAGAEPPQFPAGDGLVKVPAAWLLERAGFTRGFRPPGSRAGISSRHVLALINIDGTCASDLVSLARHLRSEVARRFSIELEIEPVPLGFTPGELG